MHAIIIFLFLYKFIYTFCATKDFSRVSVIGDIGSNLTTQIDMCSNVRISIKKEVGHSAWFLKDHIGIRSQFTAESTTTTEITFYDISNDDSGLYKITGSVKGEALCTKTIILGVSKTVIATEGSTVYESFEIPLMEHQHLLFSWTHPNYPRGLEDRIKMLNVDGWHKIEIENYMTVLNGDYKLYLWNQNPNDILYQFVLRLTGIKAEPEYVRITEGQRFDFNLTIDPTVALRLTNVYVKKLYEEDKWSSILVTFDLFLTNYGKDSYISLHIDRTVTHQDAGTYLLFDQDNRLIKKILFQITTSMHEVKVKKFSNVLITFQLPCIDLSLNGLKLKWILPQVLFINPISLEETQNSTHSSLLIKNFKSGLRGAYELVLNDEEMTPVYYYSGFYYCDD